MRSSTGLTLVELLTSIALVAVLGTLAVPGMNQLVSDTRRTAAVNDLFHAMFLARSEAMKRGQMVTVCKSADRQTCAGKGTQWTAGAIVFVNKDGDEPAVRDPAEPLLSVYEGWPSGSITSTRASYSFRPNTQGVVNGTLVFCDRRGSDHARAIVINHAGRPRVTDRDADNKPLPCPPGSP
jgi:type IV fimbrial biogenesis protein FimT